MSRLIGYARVSTGEQTTASQTDALRVAGCFDLFTEHASGADRERPELARAIAATRAGDVLVVTRLDRLARSVQHLLEVIEQLQARGAGFRSLGDPIDTSTPQGVFTLQILGAVAELERQLIAARTRAGLKAAMARGARPGNPGVRERLPEAIAKITKARAARHLDQLLATVDDWLPTVRQMRPQHDWATVVAKLNEGGGSWRTERLLRAVKLLVAEHLAEPALLGRAPRKSANRRAREAAAAMRRASPTITLQEIGRQLHAMAIPSARGHLTWSASMVAQLLKPEPGQERHPHAGAAGRREGARREVQPTLSRPAQPHGAFSSATLNASDQSASATGRVSVFKRVGIRLGLEAVRGQCQ